MTSEVKNILIVDDEENLTWSLTRNLQRSFTNFEIISTTSGKEAYEILTQRKIDLLISDIKMPDMDGITLLSFARKHHPSLNVILMTSFRYPEYKKLAEEEKVYFFEKPFDIEDMKSQIQKIFYSTEKYQKAALNLSTLIKKYYEQGFSGWLFLKNGNSSGKLFFKDGIIIDAQANSLTGEMALIHLLSWAGVEQVEENSGEVSEKQTIYYGWKLLEKELIAA